MTDTVLAQEPVLRLTVFLGMLGLMAGAEALRPRRPRTRPRWLRWGNTLALMVLSTLLVRLALPLLAVEMALHARAAGWGLFNQVPAPGWLAFATAVVLLDLIIYAQHRVMHTVPLFWRLHRMHHADTDVDVVTGLRFHPLELLLSMGVKLAAVAMLGAPPVAVLVFELTLNATALFNHANLRLPGAVDRGLRWLLVTPDMHRVHHSPHREETDSNFGFALSLWDRMFRSYRAQPRDGHETMTLGLAEFRAAREQWLDRLLLQPWRRPDAPPKGTPAPRR